MLGACRHGNRVFAYGRWWGCGAATGKWSPQIWAKGQLVCPCVCARAAAHLNTASWIRGGAVCSFAKQPVNTKQSAPLFQGCCSVVSCSSSLRARRHLQHLSTHTNTLIFFLTLFLVVHLTDLSSAHPMWVRVKACVCFGSKGDGGWSWGVCVGRGWGYSVCDREGKWVLTPTHSIPRPIKARNSNYATIMWQTGKPICAIQSQTHTFSE